MDQLTYITDMLTAINKYGVIVLFCTAILLILTLYLVWSLHTKIDKSIKNHETMQREIKDLKAIIQRGNIDGKYDERSDQSDLGRGELLHSSSIAGGK
jgi:Flp pilus assembly protein TadB